MNILRPYQQSALEAIFEEWKEHDSTVVVMPTGTGKTQVFAAAIKKALPKRAMVLVHRGELAWQAVRRIESLGVEVSIEMAEQRASTAFYNQSEVVVSTIQTQIAGNAGMGRMAKFNPNDFGLLIVDEAHHATSESWVKVINHYRQNPDLRVLGVTATPDRADEQALGKVFQSVAYDYEILDAINDGWLAPIMQQMVTIEGLDFSSMRTTAGDLNGADLAEVMEAEKNLHGIASASIDIIGNRRTLVFTVSVKQAEMLSEIFNRHRPGMADWVCGKTPKDKRHELLKKFDSGETQIMVNVGVLTEGYDSPGVECIVQGRPTKSRCLYSQMVGRATRPLPGIVDGLDTAQERIDAIASSSKKNCLVIDFVGNSGRHKLMTTADILGGNFEEEEIELAERRIKEKGESANMTEELENARAELEERKRREAARKMRLIGKAKFSARTINPFDVFQLEPQRERGWDSEKTLTEKQNSLLLKQGIDPTQMPYGQAKQVLNEMFRRWNRKLATLKQCNLLQRHGYDTKEMSMAHATDLITAIKNNGWKRPLNYSYTEVPQEKFIPSPKPIIIKDAREKFKASDEQWF